MIVIVNQSIKFKREFSNLFGVFAKKFELKQEIFSGVRFLNLTLNKKIGERTAKKIFKNNNDSFLFLENSRLLSEKFITKYTPQDIFFRSMCKNFFLKVIEKGNINPEKLRISVFDLCGEYTHLLKKLIFCSRDLKVISNNVKAYSKVQYNLFKEYGASFFLSNDVSYLFDSNIIFAPAKIEKFLPTKRECIVFTSEQSSVPIDGTVYSMYKFPKILELEKILPFKFPQEYFLAALYDICKLRKLESLVPYYCSDGVSTLNIDDLIMRISNF